jgi:hypothetical protein
VIPARMDIAIDEIKNLDKIIEVANPRISERVFLYFIFLLRVRWLKLNKYFIDIIKIYKYKSYFFKFLNLVTAKE